MHLKLKISADGPNWYSQRGVNTQKIRRDSTYRGERRFAIAAHADQTMVTRIAELKSQLTEALASKCYGDVSKLAAELEALTNRESSKESTPAAAPDNVIASMSYDKWCFGALSYTPRGGVAHTPGRMYPCGSVFEAPLQGIWWKVYPCGSFFQDFSARRMCHPSPWGVR